VFVTLAPMLDGLWQDARFAVRTLRRQPWFTTTAVLILALGIGVTAAVVNVCDALLLRPLPYLDADRLVALRSIHARTPGTGLASPLDLADWQARTKSFEAIAGYHWKTVDLTGGSSSERLHGLLVSPEFFQVFGITRVDGRIFSARDQGTDRIILSRALWTRRFAADRAVIGAMLDVNVINLSRAGSTPHLVLGVVPMDVHFPPLTADFNRGAVTQMAVGDVEDQIDFWLPFPFAQDSRRDDRTIDVVAKLRPGITIEQAQAEIDVVSRALATTFPSTNRDWRVQVVPLRTQILGASRRVVLWLLLAAALVFVIACGNVSTLLLASGLVRQRDLAVRSALGASRFRVARQMLIESLLIAFIATASGVVLMSVATRLLAPRFPPEVPLIRNAGIHGFVLVFAVVVAVATSCLTGLVPAWMSSARASAPLLNARGQSAGRQHHRTISVLVAAQVALTIVLLVSTGLLFRSAARLLRIDPGFESSNILTMAISLPNNKFDWQHNVVFSRDVVNAVKTNPVVLDAAVIQGVPMRPGGFSTTFTVEGMPIPDAADLPVARLRVISPDYFRVMKIPLLDGRIFDERDAIGERGRPKFVIINQALAARYWPGALAVGKRLRGGSADWVTVAGVVGDVRYAGLDSPASLEIYLPEALFPQSAITLLIKTTTDPSTIVMDMRARIARIDREAFVTDIRTMDELIADSLASRRFATALLAICAALGLLLAVSGIYGLVAQTVAQRQFEIGVRVALGATPSRVVRLMLQRAVTPVAGGAIIGLVTMIAAARLLSALLFETRPFDGVTFAAAAGSFIVVALIAAGIPATRATKVDPLVTLRSE
jgi:putative ABC transport system permease protein